MSTWLRNHYLSYASDYGNSAEAGGHLWLHLWRFATDVTAYAPSLLIFDTVAVGTDHQQKASEAFIRQVMGRYPACRLVVMLFPSFLDVTNDAEVSTPFNAESMTALRALATNYGFVYIDYPAELITLVSGGAHLADYYTAPDGIHPNAAGHAVVTGLLEAALPAIIAGSAPTLAAPIYDTDGDYLHDPASQDGTDDTARTGVWTDTDTTTESSEVGATITYTVTAASVGIEPPAAYTNPTLAVSIDGGAFGTAEYVTTNGIGVGAYGVHTVTFKVTSGTLKIATVWTL